MLCLHVEQRAHLVALTLKLADSTQHSVSRLQTCQSICQELVLFCSKHLLTCCVVQRDGYVRECLVEQGQLPAVIALLDTTGPAAPAVRFCAASALATLILDDATMAAVAARGEAPLLFEHSIAVLKVLLSAW